MRLDHNQVTETRPLAYTKVLCTDSGSGGNRVGQEGSTSDGGKDSRGTKTAVPRSWWEVAMGGTAVCVASPNPRIGYRSCPIGPGFGRAGPAWSRKGVRRPGPLFRLTASRRVRQPRTVAIYIRNHPAPGWAAGGFTIGQDTRGLLSTAKRKGLRIVIMVPDRDTLGRIPVDFADFQGWFCGPGID